MRSLIPAIFWLFVVLGGAPASAEPDKARANELAAEAVAAFGDEDYADAAKLFAEAYAVFPQQSLKLNEMIAWYKADQCQSAMTVADWLSTDGGELTEDDQSNLNRVTSDCLFREARAQFEAGNLDGASATLTRIEEPDVEIARAMGALEVEIENKRKENADQQTVVVTPPPQVEPADPPPSWAKWTGIGLLGGGVTLGVITLVKWQVERGQLEDGYNVIARDHGCTYSLKENAFSGTMCDVAAMRQDPRYDDFENGQVKFNSTLNGIFGATAAVAGVVGGGVLVYYLIRKAKHDNYVDSQAPAAMLLPDLRPGFTGAAFQLRF